MNGLLGFSSVPDHKGFHGPTVDHDSPVLFGLLAHPDNKVRPKFLNNVRFGIPRKRNFDLLIVV